MAQKVSINYTTRAQDDSKSTKSITNVNPAATGDQLLAFTQGLVGLTSDFYVDADRIDRQSLSDYAGKTPTTGEFTLSFSNLNDPDVRPTPFKVASISLTLNRALTSYSEFSVSAWYLYDDLGVMKFDNKYSRIAVKENVSTGQLENVINIVIADFEGDLVDEHFYIKVYVYETDTYAAATFAYEFDWRAS